MSGALSFAMPRLIFQNAIVQWEMVGCKPLDKLRRQSGSCCNAM